MSETSVILASSNESEKFTDCHIGTKLQFTNEKKVELGYVSLFVVLSAYSKF